MNEIPRPLDKALTDAAESLFKPEEVLVALHQLMRTSVFVEHSPLRAKPSLWDAFMLQEDEFISFYKSARSTLEIYTEVLRAASKRSLAEKGSPKHGDLEKICHDKSVQVRERDSCIEALGHLSGKFSAMLAVL